jgi:hypothetical protein
MVLSGHWWIGESVDVFNVHALSTLNMRRAKYLEMPEAVVSTCK